MQSKQNTLFLVLLRPIFELQAKIASAIGNKKVNALTLEWKRIRSQNWIPTRAKTFFWSSPNFGQKIAPIPGVNSGGYLGGALGHGPRAVTTGGPGGRAP